ncbi:MAG: hypothetical protein A4E48_00146 [Methanosaeta sp. PtaU1.Bin060]|nr:MAG: hypothetical protein A4E48_00146 [Methanosaeta sp. PtaU1.Bin060]
MAERTEGDYRLRPALLRLREDLEGDLLGSLLPGHEDRPAAAEGLQPEVQGLGPKRLDQPLKDRRELWRVDPILRSGQETSIVGRDQQPIQWHRNQILFLPENLQDQVQGVANCGTLVLLRHCGVHPGPDLWLLHPLDSGPQVAVADGAGRHDRKLCLDEVSGGKADCHKLIGDVSRPAAVPVLQLLQGDPKGPADSPRGDVHLPSRRPGDAARIVGDLHILRLFGLLYMLSHRPNSSMILFTSSGLLIFSAPRTTLPLGASSRPISIAWTAPCGKKSRNSPERGTSAILP